MGFVLKLYPKPQVSPTSLHVKPHFGGKVQFLHFFNTKGYFDCFLFIEHAGRGLRDREAERVEHPDP